MLTSQSSSQSKFKCFHHPQKDVQLICTEPFCNGYRFFCASCLLGETSHFISHKPTIKDITDVLNTYSHQNLKHTEVSELQQGLMRVKEQVKNYEHVIKQKHANYMTVIEAIEVQFQQTKASLVREVEEYLSNLVSKQHAHFKYLENKLKVHLRDDSLSEWMTLDRKSEQEITAFFENIIKSPLQSTKEFSNEINSYTLSFSRNIQELDAQQNTKMLGFFTKDLSEFLKNKFAELKQLLIMTAEDLPMRPTVNNNAAVPHQRLFQNTAAGLATPMNNNHNTSMFSEQDYRFKNYRSVGPSSLKSSRIHQNNNHFNNVYAEDQFSNHIDFEEDTVNNTNVNQLQQSSINASEMILPNISNLNNTPRSHAQQSIATKSSNNNANPLHTGGITSMIAFQENTSKKIIATGSTDTTIKFWQLESSSFDYIKTLRGHTAPVFALARIEKEGNVFLASASQNGELKIWNPTLQGQELLASYQEHSDAILYLHLSDDFLISGSMDKTVKIWNLNELFCTQTLTQDESVTGLCCITRESIATKSLISACGEGFRIWNQKHPGEFKLKSYNNKAHKKGVSCVAAIGIKGIDIATAGRDGLIKLWNLDKGVCVNQLEGHKETVYQLFSAGPGHKRELYSSSIDGTIKVWNPPNQLAQYDNGHKYSGQCQQFGQFVVFEQHNFILSACNDSNIIKIITIT